MKKIFLIAILTLFCSSLIAQETTSNDTTSHDADDLAKQLQNPIASLISVPFQGNYDFGIGPADGSRFFLNFQPVLPISISENWNLVTRLVLPFISQNNVAGNSGTQTGLGDALLSGFFSPKSPTESGLVWGAGPVFQIPTATNDVLGAEKFGIGPTVVALKQSGQLTIGALINHVWSIAGNEDRADVNNTFFQPFVAHNFKGGYALAVNSEILQNWDAKATNGSLNIMASKVINIGNQLSQVFVGPRIPFGNANNAEWGIRGGLTLLFPKG